jgi:ComEC/Rec2-related protein
MSVGAFVFAAIYVVFIGAEMSAVRALLAASCACAHLLSERETSFAQRWGLALLGMELIWPWSVFDIGVALTFAALLGIGLGSDIAGKSKVAQTFWVTFIVWLCTSMIIVAWQGTVSPVGLILNLAIAAPWSVINCVVGLCALSLSFIPLPGALYPLKLVALINQTLSDIVLYIGESSFGGWQVEGLVRIFVLLLLAAALALVLRLTVRKKRVRT